MLAQFWELYALFFRVGAATFGGGHTMLPLLRREIVEQRAWMEDEQLIDYFALSQGLPGLVGINIAAFIGFHRRRVPGVIAAALGVASPCLIIISLIYFLLSGFQDDPYVRHALAGISVCVVALILNAILTMWKKGVRDLFGLLLFLAAFAVSAFTTFSPVPVVIICALLGVVVHPILVRRKEGQP